jgi:acyl carrier protein
MSATTEGELLSQVKAWLLARKPEIEDVDLDLDLIENRIIDSLSFLEFLFFLEEISGREIQSTADSTHMFRTLRAIRDNLFSRAEV